jgi:hypothetical protein
MRSHFGKDRRDHIHDTETRSHIGKERRDRIHATERRSHSHLVRCSLYIGLKAKELSDKAYVHL